MDAYGLALSFGFESGMMYYTIPAMSDAACIQIKTYITRKMIERQLDELDCDVVLKISINL